MWTETIMLVQVVTLQSRILGMSVSNLDWNINKPDTDFFKPPQANNE
jgi:hypothetical protein